MDQAFVLVLYWELYVMSTRYFRNYDPSADLNFLKNYIGFDDGLVYFHALL